MTAQPRSVFTAIRREIYLAGCWTAYRFQLALEAGRLEPIFIVVRYRGVRGMRRASKNASTSRADHLTSRHSELQLPKFGRQLASRESICRSCDQGPKSPFLHPAVHAVDAGETGLCSLLGYVYRPCLESPAFVGNSH